MNELIRQLTRAGRFPGSPVFTQDFAAAPGSEPVCNCGPDPFALLKVAILVKYGVDAREASFKFTEEANAILNRHGVLSTEEPTLAVKLEALKTSVGADNYAKLLANPEVERMAARAWHKANEGKSDVAIGEIAAMFNNAISPNALAYVLSELATDPNPVEALVSA